LKTIYYYDIGKVVKTIPCHIKLSHMLFYEHHGQAKIIENCLQCSILMFVWHRVVLFVGFIDFDMNKCIMLELWTSLKSWLFTRK
jgi:hypothetical protein